MSLPACLHGRLSVPVIGAPMFTVSGPDLVIAQCKAGIVGSFPALNARPPELLEEWLVRIRRELAAHDAAHPDRPAAPFAVNQIVHRSNDRLAHDLALCVKHQVPIIITSLGAREEVNDAVHAYGGTVLHDVINNRFARKAIEKGADGLIAVAAGAGGHAGTTSPIALIQEIREWLDGPLVLSGAIATGRAVLAAQAMGADLAYVGSAFIATREANAPDAYKQMIVESGAADIVYTNHFSGVHGNYLKPSIARAGLDPDNLQVADPSKMNFADGGAHRRAWRDIWGAGQGVGAVKAVVGAADLVARLKREYEAALDGLPVGKSRQTAGSGALPVFAGSALPPLA
jgi:nitronate monooxygenase